MHSTVQVQGKISNTYARTIIAMLCKHKQGTKALSRLPHEPCIVQVSALNKQP